MTTALSGKSTLKIDTKVIDTMDLGTATADESFVHLINWADGTGANQGKASFSDTRSLSGSASEDLDLAGGLTDALGNTLTFTAIKLLAIKAPSTNGDTIDVGGASSNQMINWVSDATDIVKIRPGGAMVLVAPDATGYAVTASTGDLLKVANADASAASYSILIVGETA